MQGRQKPLRCPTAAAFAAVFPPVRPVLHDDARIRTGLVRRGGSVPLSGFADRIGRVEGRVQEQAATIQDIRATALDLREEMRALRGEITVFREQTQRYFAWLVGILVTGFVTLMGAFASGVWAVLQVMR
jgi:hypothetical protein